MVTQNAALIVAPLLAEVEVGAPGTRTDIDAKVRPRLNIVLVEFLPSGGMFQFAFQFAEALAKAGHDVQLLTGPNPELRSSTPGFRVIEALPTWHPNTDNEGSALRRRARRAGRALLLVESWRRVLLHIRRTAPDVAHNPLPYDVNSKTQSVEKSGKLTRWLLTKAYQACDLVLVLGEGPRTELLAEFPGVRRAVVCGHGDYSSVLAASATPPPSDAPPNALFFGAWTKYKNIPLMLDAFALVRSRLPEVRLTLAGPVMPDVDLAAITARAAAIGNVDLKPGYVAMKDIPALFGAHRLVVFTYETVNISGSVHMAYTFGRPIVATDVGSMSDAVEHRVTGLLTAPDPGSVAQAVIEVLDNPVAADRMGAAGASRAQQASSWLSVADIATAAYAEALDRAPVAPVSP
jgi:glycosyltransferase involved in cell wall biosynthesis